MRALWEASKRHVHEEPIALFALVVTIAIGCFTYFQQERFQRKTDERFDKEQAQRQDERDADKAERQKERAEDKAAKEPRLVDNGVRLPSVRPGRYEITIRNAGDEQVAVRDVQFQYSDRISTPSNTAPTMVEAAGPIRTRQICFNKSHLDQNTRTFTLHLNPPEGIDPGSNLHLEICICEQAWAGQRFSYDGRLVVIYDANNRHVFDDVILDIVDPKQPEPAIPIDRKRKRNR